MSLSPPRVSGRQPTLARVCLAFVFFGALFFLATVAPQVYAQDDASTAPNGGEAGTPIDTASTGTTNNDGGGGSETPTVPLIDFGYYTCGGQKVGANRGQYLNGENWEVAGIPDYIDDQDPTLISGSGNITYAPAATSRGYPQCWGRNQQNNCFDKWAPTLEAPRRVFCDTSRDAIGLDFVKGDQGPPLCLVYGGGNRLFKMRFYPIVDQFALLQIQDSFNGSDLARPSLQHLGTAFQVEMAGFASDHKHRFSYVQSSECVDQFVNGTRVGCTIGGVSCIVVPFHTIVITLDRGAMKSIEWDDDCSLCRNDYCVDGNCANDVNQCTTSPIATPEAATDCDFKLYVSWAGTDSQGTYLSSSQKRLSQFRRWSLNSVYNQASNWDIGELPIAPPDTSSANVG